MNLRSKVGRAVLSLTQYLPHWKITLPYFRAPSISFTFYPDTELGLWLGYNEPAVIKSWKEATSDASVIYDVGAHIGVYSLIAAANGAKVHAFEPDQDTVLRLKKQAAKNGFADVITVNECVVSDEQGDVTLYRNPDGRKHTLQESRGVQNPEQVSSTTIDAYQREDRTQAVDLVKVDVEGAADRVFKGAINVIETGEATWIIEIHNSTEQTAVQELFPETYSRKWIDDRHVIVTP